VETPAVSWNQVSAGSTHTCAIADGDDLYCWGTPSNNQTAGAGTTSVPIRIETASDWQSVTAGTDTTCAVTTAGVRACFGRNSEGQKGRGDLTDMPAVEYFGTPDTVDWVDVDIGVGAVCGISTAADSNRLYCWGEDNYGQLGDGMETGTPTTTPTESNNTLTGWTDVRMSLQHGCGIRSPGHVYCWGYGPANGHGQGSTIQPTITEVVGGPGWVAVDTGSDVSCACRDDGRVHCWGNNHTGQLGNNQVSNFWTDAVPSADIGGGEFAVVRVGNRRGCAIKRADATGAAPRSLWCWGENLFGAIGDGSGGRFVPTPVVRDE
jgi:alpha-tubulin suppressor-like RCC1 family protein